MMNTDSEIPPQLITPCDELQIVLEHLYEMHFHGTLEYEVKAEWLSMIDTLVQNCAETEHRIPRSIKDLMADILPYFRNPPYT